LVGIVVLAGTAAAALFSSDPAPGLLRSKRWSRNLECERVSAENARERYPGQIVESSPRGDYIDRSVVICAERLTRPGLRPVLDEAILSELEAITTDLASAAQSMRPELADRTWLVQAYYPSPVVAGKISFAIKNALIRRGLRVSDRAPTLAADDVQLLTRLSPDEAYPAACRRYTATGSLGEGDVLLAVISRDPRETILHAGLCMKGPWAWLK
jgi:hypothetical protein